MRHKKHSGGGEEVLRIIAGGGNITCSFKISNGRDSYDFSSI